jgi:hypothetical protein
MSIAQSPTAQSPYGVGFASVHRVKRTAFSIALIAATVVVLGGFENGDGIPNPPEREWAARTEILRRAKVLRQDRFDASNIDFAADPNAGVIDSKFTQCWYKPGEVSGTTPKFDCDLQDGTKVKVKYGWTREIPSETATTRLLHALGFGADRMSRVEKVRCHGCPLQPFHTRSLMELLGLDKFLDTHIDYDQYRDFTHVSVERNLKGEAIEVGKERGWAFHELKYIDPARGGATRGEVDALRLVAVFLHHWDNKESNQRLVCADSTTADCTNPLAMIQDAGSDFGPRKVDLQNWSTKPIWFGDPAQCLISMRAMPYNGGTFEDVKITEEGRRLLGDRLRQLSPKHIETLFRSAGFHDVPQWIAAFEEKVRQIVERPPCG